MEHRRIMLIAGSDSSGGAGLEADQKVTAAHGCYAMTATTALTAQNTQGVQDIHVTPAAFVAKQIHMCIEDVGVDAIKTGMLASAETVTAVASALRDLQIECPIIIDPVMISTSGSQLLPEDAVIALRSEFLPLATVLTPNIPEANLLAGRPKDFAPSTQPEIIELAKDLHKLGPQYVLIKGGHFSHGSSEAKHRSIIDVLYDGTQVTLIEKPFLTSRNTHGTGCSLASAIACNIVLGQPVIKAVQEACKYVEAGISHSISLGHGPGPINHFHSTYKLPFARGHFVDYVLDRPDVRDIWRGYTEHSFIKRLADGQLDVEKFKGYLVQDFLFLTEFARAKALSASKMRNIKGIVAEADVMLHIHREMDLHLAYCASFGLSKEEIEASKPTQACMAYTGFLHDVGHTEDWLALQIAFAPCLIGYGMIAKALYDSPETVRGEANAYWKWIENYVASDYTAAIEKGRAVLEEHAVKQSPQRIEELVGIFKAAVRLETSFWDMGQRGI